MTTDQSNPYQSPREASEAKIKAEHVVPPHFLGASSVVIAVVIYAALTMSLVFGDSTTDTIMGALLLCNWPALGLWLWASIFRSKKVILFGCLSVAGQLAIAIAMSFFVSKLHQVFEINGVVVAVVLCLTIFMWLYQQRTSRLG